MRRLLKLALVGIKLYLRELVAFFFAPMILLLFGAIYGNKPNPVFSGRGTVEVMVPAYIGVIIVTVGLMSIPINTASARESGVLRQFRTAPLHSLTYMISELTSNMAVAIPGVLFLLALTARIAEAAEMILAFPMMFLSGAAFSRGILPAGVRAFSCYLPLTHVGSLMKGMWFGDPRSRHFTEVVVLLGIMVLGGVVSFLLFR